MKNYLSILFLLLSASAFAQKKDSLNVVSDSLKNKVIKYHISKMTGGGQAVNSKRTEVTISSENINLYSEIEGRVVEFNTVIQSVDWNFNNSLTKGFAKYKGYIKRDNGETSESNLLIEADENGKLQLYDPTAPTEHILLLHIDSWTVIK